MKRALSLALDQFSETKAVLLSGPRQVGKTTLTKNWLSQGSRPLYLNWDIPDDRERILMEIFTKKATQLNIDRLVLDEIHKYPRWKAALKGFIDRGLKLSIVVTGSARLDTYQKGGDSLLGRFEQLRLYPLTVGELLDSTSPSQVPQDWLKLGESKSQSESTLERLEKRSGFPEPYFSKDENYYKRWSTRRRTLLTEQDVRDLSQIKMVSLFEHLVLLLPERVGSPLSINSLREELQTSHETITSWIDLTDRLYFSFRIKPHTTRVARSIKKETKLYLWDWAMVRDPGARFENIVAAHLLKSVHTWNDLGLGDFDLAYLRNKEKREIDFLVTENRKPIVAIECKLSDTQLSESWVPFSKVLHGVEKIQLVKKAGVDFIHPLGVRVVSASRFLAGLR